MLEKGLLTEQEFASMSKRGAGHINPEWAEWLMGYEQQFTKLIPTPVASDANQSARTRYWMPKSQTVHVERERERGYTSQLKELVEVTPRGRIGPLNPEWVEWLMGYPIGWTE